MKDMERFKGFDLQFFAEEPAPEPIETPTEPEEPAEPAEIEPEESFVDENLLTDEQKKDPMFKGYKSAYTKKTQEIAEFKNACKEAGLTPKQAANLLKEMQENPHELAERIQPKTKKADPEPEPDDDLDEYEKKIVTEAEKRAVARAKKEVMEELKPTLSKVESDRQEEARQFKNTVYSSIDQVKKDFPEIKMSKDELFAIAHRHEILPKDMEQIVPLVIGSAKYKETISKKALAEQAKKIDENKNSVGPIVNSADGVTPQALSGRAKNFDEAAERCKKYVT